VFLLGAVVGTLFFGLQFGFSIIDPLNSDWIWHGVTHDTAQHFIGWEFFRADSTGGVINGLAYPEGLPATFMDVIPLVALPLKLIAGILPTSFQYFGLWALICYALMGGLGAVLSRKVWRKVFGERSRSQQSIAVTTRTSKEPHNDGRDERTVASGLASLFAVAGALIFVLSPMVLARTLYHPSLAAHWLILLGILLIWDAPKFAKWWKSTLVWSVTLVGAVLIHPYFLPMLGAMMLISVLRNAQGKKLLMKAFKSISQVLIPIALAVASFAAIGGFALGSGAEIRDLHDKGFNLLSFAISNDYSAIVPSIPQRSYSSETLMWLGLGVWVMIITAAILWRGRYKESFKKLRTKFAKQKARNIAMAAVAFGLLAFAIGVRIDIGPTAIFQWQPPEKIYEIWSAFRAAAREAWPFYYATILLVMYWFTKGIKCKIISPASSNELSDKNFLSEKQNLHSRSLGEPAFQSKKIFRKFGESAKENNFAFIAVLLCIISLIQCGDIWFSKNAVARREGFAVARTTKPEFASINISDLVTTQKHLVMLDSGFRGDQSGTYRISRTALENGLTLNIGFFARIPDPIWTQQTTWREKVRNGELTNDGLRDYIFATRDEKFATEIANNYTVIKRDKFYFITSL